VNTSAIKNCTIQYSDRVIGICLTTELDKTAIL
jgi:hypothetical protein